MSFGKILIYMCHSPLRCSMGTGRKEFLECCERLNRLPSRAGVIVGAP